MVYGVVCKSNFNPQLRKILNFYKFVSKEEYEFIQKLRFARNRNRQQIVRAQHWRGLEKECRVPLAGFTVGPLLLDAEQSLAVTIDYYLGKMQRAWQVSQVKQWFRHVRGYFSEPNPISAS